VALLEQGIWTRLPPEVPSSLSHSMITDITLAISEYPDALYSLFMCPGKHSCVQMVWKGCQVAICEVDYPAALKVTGRFWQW